MMDNIRRDPKCEKDYGYAPDMTKYEKDISFLNRYCVFKKIADRNVEKLTNVILGKLPSTNSYEDENSDAAVKAVVEETAIIEKKKARPLKKKMMLVEATEAADEPSTKAATANATAFAADVATEIATAPNVSDINALSTATTAAKKGRPKSTKKAEEAPVVEGKKTRKVKGKVEFAIVDDN